MVKRGTQLSMGPHFWECPALDQRIRGILVIKRDPAIIRKCVKEVLMRHLIKVLNVVLPLEWWLLKAFFPCFSAIIRWPSKSTLSLMTQILWSSKIACSRGLRAPCQSHSTHIQLPCLPHLPFTTTSAPSLLFFVLFLCLLLPHCFPHVNGGQGLPSGQNNGELGLPSGQNNGGMVWHRH